MRTYRVWIMMGLFCTVICGCQTDVFYGDPGAVETVTVGYGSTDLQSIAEKMVDSLIRHPALDGRPVRYIH